MPTARDLKMFHLNTAEGHGPDKQWQLEEDQEVFKKSNLAIVIGKRKVTTNGDPTFLAGAKKILNLMFGLWQKGQLCDVIIHASADTEVLAHKTVLAAYSDSLTTMFMDHQPGGGLSL